MTAHPTFRVDLSNVSHKRGGPVLIEVLKGRAGGGPDVASRIGGTTAPPAQSAPAGFTQAPPPPAMGASLPLAGAAGVWRARSWQIQPRQLMLAIGGLVVVLTIVWVAAFRTGQHVEKKQWEDRLPMTPSGPGATNPETPINRDPLDGTGMDEPGAASPVPPTPTQTKETEVSPKPAELPALKDGLNHLVVGMFRRLSDAEESAKYLAQNGLRIIVTGPKGTDLTPKTGEFWVWAADGFEKPMSNNAAKKLRDRVVELGRLWKIQNKLAPTDFSQPYWMKYRKSGE